MMHKGYKETEIGVIPVDWEVVKLNTIGDIITGSTPKTSSQDFYIDGTRLWASPSDLGKSKEIRTTNTKLSDVGFEQIRVLAKRSILITCIGSTIGKMGIAYEEMSSNQQINAITCNENNNPDFYYYVLFKIKDKIKKLAGTQAVPLLNKTDFSQIKVIQPPLKEQEKIADILSTADAKIEAIASQIQKAETLKKGLLQKLLSEGIGHTEFRDSELGRIPESWEVVELNNLCSKIVGGGTPNSKIDSYWKNGTIYWATVKNMDNRSKYLSKTEDTITELGLKNSSANLIPANTIITATRMGLGRFFINTVEMAINQDLKALILKEVYDKNFIFWSLVSKSDFILSLGTGTTVKGIRLEELKSIKFTIPPLKEQKQIANILSIADDKLEVLRAKKETYETLKQGLMQKLLTGEVRI